jgi:pimeloyl-ACP methyl ester carboxylesterase
VLHWADPSSENPITRPVEAEMPVSPGVRRIVRAPLAAALVIGLTGGVLLAAAPVAAATKAATVPVVAVPVGATVPKLVWRSCGAPLLCASAKVPLDWSRPRGATISLALVKLPAANRSKRIGTLFVNPGGPGGSGVEMVRADPEIFPASVRARFDVVGFDPRFVGSSRPVATCMYDEAFGDFVSSQPAFPVTDEQESAFAVAEAGYAKRCAGRSYLRFASTASVARDLDLLRRAVGDAKLTYAGYSYGSYLGQMYAQLYPTMVRAMVLDGVIDAQAWTSGAGEEWRSTPFSARIGSAAGSWRTLQEFFRLCRSAGRARCDLAAQGDPETTYRAIADRLLADPVPIGGGLELDYPTLVSATASVLYSPQYWQVFAAELQALHVELTKAATTTSPASVGQTTRALAVTPSRLRLVAASVRARTPQAADRSVMPALERPDLLLARSLERRQPTQPAPVPQVTPADNTMASFAAVSCTDSRNSSDIADWVSAAHRQDQDNPYFGRAWTWAGALCATWTQRDPNAYLGPFGARTAAPILVVSTRFDPATPYEGAVATAARFPGARLLTVNGYGHTSTAVPSACAQRSVAYYLLTQKPPKSGAHCRQDLAPFH